jgi:hypothetical protein
MGEVWEIIITAVVSAGLGALGTFYVFNSQLQNLAGQLESKADKQTLGKLDGRLEELSQAIDRGKEEAVLARVTRLSIQETRAYLEQEENVARWIRPTAAVVIDRIVGERLDKNISAIVNKITPEIITIQLEKELKPSVVRYTQEAFNAVSSQFEAKPVKICRVLARSRAWADIFTVLSSWVASNCKALADTIGAGPRTVRLATGLSHE